MARSFGNLWPEVISWANLLLAYRKCRRRKRYRAPATEFHFEWESNLRRIQAELTDGTYQPGEYRHFWIHEPKPRKISAAPFRDRVVHHAVVNVLEPIFERRFVFDSYACRRGKGTHRAIRRALGYLRGSQFYLKTDIVRFFPNLDHKTLLAQLARTIRDSNFLELIRRIVDSGVGVLDDQATRTYFPGDDLFSILRPTGLPIGNLTSQFFANVYLDPLDHFIKEELRVPGYVRYADDLILFGPSKSTLVEWRDAVSQRLATLRLRLHRNKTQICPARLGVKFLGFKLHPDSIRLTQDGIRRFNRRRRRMQWLFARGLVDSKDVRESLRAWQAHAANANSTGIRRALWKRVRFSRGFHRHGVGGEQK